MNGEPLPQALDPPGFTHFALTWICFDKTERRFYMSNLIVASGTIFRLARLTIHKMPNSVVARGSNVLLARALRSMTVLAEKEHIRPAWQSI